MAQMNLTTKQKQTHRHRNRPVVARGRRGREPGGLVARGRQGRECGGLGVWAW